MRIVIRWARGNLWTPDKMKEIELSEANERNPYNAQTVRQSEYSTTTLRTIMRTVQDAHSHRPKSNEYSLFFFFNEKDKRETSKVETKVEKSKKQKKTFSSVCVCAFFHRSNGG